MAILVDQPRWPWRGRRWAHLISDHDADELHQFAAGLGLRRLAFQGDHYDIPDERYEAALQAGARSVDSRVIVRRLRESGLRRRGGLGWSVRLRWESGAADRPDERRLASLRLPRGAETDLGELANRADTTGLIVLSRPGEWGLGWSGETPPPELTVPPRRWPSRHDGLHHLDWFVPGPDPGDR